MTFKLFEDDAYLRSCEAQVLSMPSPHEIVLDRTCFYPLGGGQPGDQGYIELQTGEQLKVVNTRYTKDRSAIIHDLEKEAHLLAGVKVVAHIDWQRRYSIMRAHTALHLLSVLLPYPVTGGQIDAAKGRLDFKLPPIALDKEALSQQLTELAARDEPVSTDWITEQQLDDNPELVKTLSVTPPRGTGKIRLIRVGKKTDLQPCGGTHVSTTGEIGPIRVTKIESKGQQNRRLRIQLEE
ncbi:alanyl-tRNA editing protein [Polycladidibacter stylochi]|uniref:alanyl-tRNA editing protein n=1 Tax=Polycladidibacter stylochi TaxID=1807766 RepID=UPI0008302ABE|nr:alanyl-tRNA editing protein [Pseudovibrio stylochi]